jgi:hypothetical protein
MVCTPIYSFSALEGKYLEPATSSHPIDAEGYEIRPDFISLVRELNLLEVWMKICTNICKILIRFVPPS